jgi:hypothetical protein
LEGIQNGLRQAKKTWEVLKSIDPMKFLESFSTVENIHDTDMDTVRTDSSLSAGHECVTTGSENDSLPHHSQFRNSQFSFQAALSKEEIRRRFHANLQQEFCL